MKNKFFKIALSAVLSLSCLAAGFTGASGLDGNANNITKDGYTITKVSHPSSTNPMRMNSFSFVFVRFRGSLLSL